MNSRFFSTYGHCAFLQLTCKLKSSHLQKTIKGSRSVPTFFCLRQDCFSFYSYQYGAMIVFKDDSFFCFASQSFFHNNFKFCIFFISFSFFYHLLLNFKVSLIRFHFACLTDLYNLTESIYA